MRGSSEWGGGRSTKTSFVHLLSDFPIDIYFNKQFHKYFLCDISGYEILGKSKWRRMQWMIENDTDYTLES